MRHIRILGIGSSCLITLPNKIVEIGGVRMPLGTGSEIRSNGAVGSEHAKLIRDFVKAYFVMISRSDAFLGMLIHRSSQKRISQRLVFSLGGHIKLTFRSFYFEIDKMG